MIQRQSSKQIEQEKILFESDAIMRPDIFEQLSKYIQQGGQIETISKVLMERYRGIPNMIYIVTQVLKDVAPQLPDSQNLDPEEIIKQQVRNAMLKIFKIDKMDNLLLSQKKIPKEFKIMFKNPFWIDTIVTLSENPDYSGSLFIAYCMNKICQSHPEMITTLPPFYISYASYQHVLQYILSQIKMNPNQKLVDRLVKIISTDDRTLTHAALVLHALPQEGLIKITDKLKESKKNLFLKVYLNLNSACDMQLSNKIVGNAKLRISDLQDISKLENISPQMKTLIIQKVSDLLKDRNNNKQIINAAINCLLKITNLEVSEDDHKFIVTAFENIFQPNFRVVENLNVILHAIKFPCFGDILKEIALSQLNPQMERPDYTGKSPQSQIIREFAYQYRQKIPSLVKPLIKAYQIIENSDNEYLLEEFFDIFIYLVRLGYSKDILKQYSDIITSKNSRSPHLHRDFLKTLLQLKFPSNGKLPSVCRFIEAMTILFSNENIIRKILPESSANMLNTYRTNINILKSFLDRIPDDIDLYISKEANDILIEIRDRINDLGA